MAGRPAFSLALAVSLVLAGCSGPRQLFGSPFLPGQTTLPPSATPAPPAWLAPGVRLSWYVAAASVANSRFSIVEDPNGNLMNPRTGKKYRRTDDPGGEGQPGASGDGYSVVDVVAVDGRRAVLSMSLYGIDRVNNIYLVTPLGGQSLDISRVDGAWASPDLLNKAMVEGFTEYLLLRGPYQVGSTTYDSLSFVSGLGTSNYASYTFDMATGILVSANTSTGGVTSPFHIENEAPPVGNTQLTVARFAGMRGRPLPGLAASTPEWVARTSELSYSGTYNWTNPIDPSSGNLTFPMQHLVTLGPGGPGWARYNARTIVPQMGVDTWLEGVTGVTGLYWYAPAGLAQMSAGQVLDTDPLTGEQTTVAAAGAQVVIETRAPGVFTQGTYDAASGQLVGFGSQQLANGITTTLQLTGSR